MGLTIHFDLKAAPGTDAEEALALVQAMRRRAQSFRRRGRVEAVSPIRTDARTLRRAREYKTVPHPWQPDCKSGIEIPAAEGFLFEVAVGADCEPLPLALCRYPASVVMGGKCYRTGLRGWRFHGFSKTQYASLHGWEHFRRCHTAVIDLLAELRTLGVTVKISDEGDYWPRRNEAALRRNVNQMNGLVAAAAGALKDATEDGTGPGAIQSPIFAHPQFERLEAEGEAEAKGVVEALRKALG